MIDRMTIAAVARELGLSWDTVNTIAMDATQMIVAADTTRLDGVRVIGVDEHRWSHTGHTDGFVTVSPRPTSLSDFSGFDVMAKYHNVTGGDSKFYVFAMPRWSKTG